ncbi:MAG TPA: ornithine cyclodeaminase family protein, partial [Methylomirabilota bacterium]|nr:ornithine cyclodeaminase family protein [Methylomirabilota bacterium]
FGALAAGRACVPPRTAVPAGEDAVLLVMPAALAAAPGDDGGLGAKLVTYFGGNRARGHPTLYASYLLLDAGSGRPLAFLEASFVTAIRTGATSALAARLLARPGAERLACFGAGVQAAFQVRCLAAVLPIRHVTVVGRDPDRARRLAGALAGELGVAAEASGDGSGAVREADVVTCATTSPTPVVHGADLRPGAHVDAVGAFRPGDRELDTEAVRRARLVVDTYAGALAEAGDVLIPLREGAIGRDHVAGELAELVSGACRGRLAPDDITLFKSVGCALEDLATARLAYDLARRHAVGTEVAL